MIREITPEDCEQAKELVNEFALMMLPQDVDMIVAALAGLTLYITCCKKMEVTKDQMAEVFAKSIESYTHDLSNMVMQ